MHTVSNIDERRQFREAYRRLIRAVGPVAETDDIASIHCLISGGINAGHYGRNGFGMSLLVHRIQAAALLAEAVSPDRSMTLSLLIAPLCQSGYISAEKVREDWGDDVAKLVGGLMNVVALYAKNPSVESDNFRNLLLSAGG